MIKAKVISNKENSITLSLDDGQAFTVPKEAGLNNVKEGDQINILLAAPGQENQASADLAKNLLNGLINQKS